MAYKRFTTTYTLKNHLFLCLNLAIKQIYFCNNAFQFNPYDSFPINHDARMALNKKFNMTSCF